VYALQSDARPTDELRKFHKLLAAFQHRGYAIFHKEPNVLGSFDSSESGAAASHSIGSLTQMLL